MKWPLDEEDDQSFGDYVSFVDDGRALVAAGYSAKLSLVDLEGPAGVEGVALNSSGFYRASGREFVSVHRAAELDHLLTWRIPPSM